MVITLTYQRCGKEGVRRNRPAKYCWPCSSQVRNDNGAAAAHAAVNHAVNTGRLPRASECTCSDCGRQAKDYDHRDYGRPLDVEPVCRSCNKLRGPAVAATQGA